MKRHTQLIKHDPDNGAYGDCFRTVLACLLDLDSPLDVPHFCNGPMEETGDWLQRCQDWLRPQGLYLFTMVMHESLGWEGLLEWTAQANPGIHHIIAGESPRGTNHVVIVKDGEMVWDPTPFEEKGLVAPYDDPPNFGWCVEILAKLV